MSIRGLGNRVHLTSKGWDCNREDANANSDTDITTTANINC